MSISSCLRHNCDKVVGGAGECRSDPPMLCTSNARHHPRQAGRPHRRPQMKSFKRPSLQMLPESGHIRSTLVYLHPKTAVLHQVAQDATYSATEVQNLCTWFPPGNGL